MKSSVDALGLTIGLLKVYNYYRVVLGLTFFIVLFQTTVETRLGSACTADWFILGRFCVHLYQPVKPGAGAGHSASRFFERQLPNFTLVLFDIIALTLSHVLQWRCRPAGSRA